MEAAHCNFADSRWKAAVRWEGAMRTGVEWSRVDLVEHHDEDPGLVRPEDARMRKEAATEGALPQQQRH